MIAHCSSRASMTRPSHHLAHSCECETSEDRKSFPVSETRQGSAISSFPLHLNVFPPHLTCSETHTSFLAWRTRLREASNEAPSRLEVRPPRPCFAVQYILQYGTHHELVQKEPSCGASIRWSPFCVVDMPMECSYPPCFIPFLSTSKWQSVPPPPFAHTVNHDVVSAAVRVCSFQWILKPSIAKGHGMSQTKPAPSSSAAEIGLVCFLLATDVLLVYKALRC